MPLETGRPTTLQPSAAIDSVDRGTIVIPAGTYRIDGQLSIQESQLVLRGSGPSKSVLAFTHSMEDLFWPGTAVELERWTD